MAKWTKNLRMELGAILLVIGLALTVVSWALKFADTTPSWLESYAVATDRPEGDYNLFVFIIGPILLIWGGFWVGEQLVLRRRFERLIDTPKRSEFSSRRKELEDLSKRLPEGFGKRIKEKEGELGSKRTT